MSMVPHRLEKLDGPLGGVTLCSCGVTMRRRGESDEVQRAWFKIHLELMEYADWEEGRRGGLYNHPSGSIRGVVDVPLPD